MTTTQGWLKWINDHTSAGAYNSHPAMVAKIRAGMDAIVIYERLARSKNIVLVTKAPFGTKLQATFYHSIVGIPILPDDLHYVLRSGMTLGNPLKTQPKSVFGATSNRHAPPSYN